MIKSEDIYRIGRIGKTHGVKGEVSFQFDDDVFDRLDADYVFIEIDGLPVPFFFEEYRFRSDETALVKFEGVDTEEQASELTGCDVFFPRQDDNGDDGLPLSVAEIIGYEVVDAKDGKAVGRIKAVDDATINTLFEVEADGGQTILLPASDDLIKATDRRQRTITMTIPDGLLSL